MDKLPNWKPTHNEKHKYKNISIWTTNNKQQAGSS